MESALIANPFCPPIQPDPLIAQAMSLAPLRTVAAGILDALTGSKQTASYQANSITEQELEQATAQCDAALERIAQVVYGKPLQIKQALACLLARGHLLLEDVPGVGKTTLAQSLSAALGLDRSRIQFTADMMPSDILGGSVFDRQSQEFIFHRGPIFAQVLLADEINRASPKTQSALLEAMAERQVSVDGITHALPKPFFVLATQNPLHQMGTFPLPESQVDRFLMSLSLGYPDEEAEMRMLMQGHPGAQAEPLSAYKPMGADQLLAIQALVERVHVSEQVASYAYRVIQATRQCGLYVDGLSPRAGMAWIRAAKAWALLSGRSWVLPDDLQAIFVECTLHRLIPKSTGHGIRADREMSLRDWLRSIAIDDVGTKKRA